MKKTICMMIAAATFSTSVEISATEKNFYSVEKFADLEIKFRDLKT